MSLGQAAKADDAARELHKPLVQISAVFVADPQAFELMEPSEGTLDNPPRTSQAGAVSGAASGYVRLDATVPQKPSVLVEVVAAIGEQALGLVTRTSPQPSYPGDRVQQGNGGVQTFSALCSSC